MGKSNHLSDLVKNVQFFVTTCREKNKKLMSMSSLDLSDDEIYTTTMNLLEDKKYGDKDDKGNYMKIIVVKNFQMN